MTSIIDHLDVFVKLEYVNKLVSDFDELFALKKDILKQDPSNFVAIYIYRDKANHSCSVIGRFRSLPKFLQAFSERVKVCFSELFDLTLFRSQL
jgi:hypothetical protein